jgi:hypothetical protein
MKLKLDKVIKLCLESFCSGNFFNFQLEQRKSNKYGMSSERNRDKKFFALLNCAEWRERKFQSCPCLLHGSILLLTLVFYRRVLLLVNRLHIQDITLVVVPYQLSFEGCLG